MRLQKEAARAVCGEAEQQAEREEDTNPNKVEEIEELAEQFEEKIEEEVGEKLSEIDNESLKEEKLAEFEHAHHLTQDQRDELEAKHHIHVFHPFIVNTDCSRIKTSHYCGLKL